MTVRIDISALRRQVDTLTATYPEMVEDDDLLAGMVEGETDVFEVLSRLVREAGEAKALGNGIAGYIKELGERKARVERREDAARALIMAVMDAANLTKAQLPEATLSVRAGTPRAVVDDLAALPDDLVRIERKADMAAIKDAVSAGRDVPGIHMSNGAPSLTVRVK